MLLPEPPVRKPASRVRRCWIIISALSAAAVVLGYGWHKGPTRWQVERQVREGIPIGTSRSQTESWLRSRQIGFVVVAGASADSFGGREVGAHVGMAGNPVSATIRGQVQPALVDWFWDGVVYVYLFFDPDDKLIGYDFADFVEAL
jgi:hypothetical protein